MAIRVALYLKDKTYAERLADYINLKYSDNIRLYQYTEENAFYHYLESNSMDVVLIDEDFDRQRLGAIRNIKVCIMTERLSESYPDSGDNEHFYIFKYQKASTICGELFRVVSKGSQVLFKRNEGGTHIWAFASLKGGAGASTVSSAFAIYQARTGRKVLFLNMHILGNSSGVFDHNEQSKGNFDDIILSLKTAKGSMHTKLLSILCQSEYGVYYYKGVSNPYDIGELRDIDIERLFSSLRETDFDNVIIDFNMSFDDYNWAIMHYSDRIVLVSDGTVYSKNNFSDVLKIVDYMDKKKKTRVIDKFFIISNKIDSDDAIDVGNNQIKTIGVIDLVNISDMEQLAVHIASNARYFSFNS